MYKSYDEYLNELNNTLVCILEEESDMSTAQQIAEACLRDKLDACLSSVYCESLPLSPACRRDLVRKWRGTGTMKVVLLGELVEPKLSEHEQSSEGAKALMLWTKIIKTLLSA